ncbi:MAG: hypothetical protein LIO78_00570 [Clostridiales bacterium]|nr:hypothetical protein [Clostridiales bacterium]
MNQKNKERTGSAFAHTRAGSPGERAGRAVRRHALIFRGAILFLLAAYLGGVGCVLYADTKVSSRLRGVFLLAVGTALALRLLLAVWDELTRRRVSRKDLQTRRDYNAYLARWRKDAASRNAALLAMAKQDLCLGQPEQALRDLDTLTPEKLSKAQLKTLFFYQAAAARLTGDEGLCADALLRCKGIPLEGPGYLTDTELDTLFRADTPEAAQQVELADAVSVWGGRTPRQRSVLLPLWGAFQVGYTAWYYGVAALLPYRYEYRTGFAVLSLVLIFWGWAALALVLIYKADTWLRPRLQSTSQRILVGLTTALAVLLVLVCLVGYGLLMAAFQDPEEDIGDGLLIVTDENYLRPEHNTYTYYQAHGPFLRSYYGPVEDEEDEASSATDSAAQPEASDSAVQPEAESAVDTEEPVSAETPEEEALLLIAQSLANSGELDGTDLDALELRYSAKGSLYAVLWSEPWEEDETVTARGRLVYDRESANAKCYLFVYYQDYLAADGSEAKSTSILEFYAVNKLSGEVIPGDKHSWSDVASEAYREATGE